MARVRSPHTSQPIISTGTRMEKIAPPNNVNHLIARICSVVIKEDAQRVDRAVYRDARFLAIGAWNSESCTAILLRA